MGRVGGSFAPKNIIQQTRHKSSPKYFTSTFKIPVFHYIQYMIKHALYLCLICMACSTFAQSIDATKLTGKWQVSRLKEGTLEFTPEDVAKGPYVVIEKKIKQDAKYVPTKQDSSAARMTHFSVKQRLTISFIDADGKGNLKAVLGTQGQEWDGVVPFAGTYQVAGNKLALNLKKSGAIINTNLLYTNGELVYNDDKGNLIMAFKKL